MRIYVRVDKVAELREDLRGPQCHLKLTMGTVIMRTRSATADLFQGTLDFCEPITRQPNELFVLHAASADQLNYLKIRIQLRKNRWLLRSERVAEAVIPLAMIDVDRSLVASFPMTAIADREKVDSNVAEQTPSIPPVGKVLVRVEVEQDEAPDDRTGQTDRIDAPAGRNTSPVPSAPETSQLHEQHQRIPLQQQDESNAVTSAGGATAAAPPASSNPSSSPLSSARVLVTPATGDGGRRRDSPIHKKRVLTRTCGSQTDRLSITSEDVAALKDVPSLSNAQAASPHDAVGMVRLGPPPPMDALRGHPSRLPVDALALQHTLPAYPTDEMEGLLLFCDHSQKYQRELEGSLARFHLDRLKARARALGHSGPERQSKERSASSQGGSYSDPPRHRPMYREEDQPWDLDRMSSLL